VVRHVHEPDGTMRYHQAEDHLHLHLVCHACGETVEFVETSIGDPLHHVLQERIGFTADLTHFPIAGICAACLAIASSLPQASRIA
jgi:Fe2+ or Zn2+ uptake regulation protein